MRSLHGESFGDNNKERWTPSPWPRHRRGTWKTRSPQSSPGSLSSSDPGSPWTCLSHLLNPTTRSPRTGGIPVQKVFPYRRYSRTYRRCNPAQSRDAFRSYLESMGHVTRPCSKHSLLSPPPMNEWMNTIIERMNKWRAKATITHTHTQACKCMCVSVFFW